MSDIPLSASDLIEIDKEVTDAMSRGEIGDDLLIEKDGSPAMVSVDDLVADTVVKQGQDEELNDELEVEDEVIDEDEEVLEDDELIEDDLLSEEGIDKDVKPKVKLTTKQQLKKMQGLAETRLNAFNKVSNSPELALGKAAASNPSLVKLVQAVNLGLIDPDALLQGGPQAIQSQGKVEPLVAPVQPERPSDFNREDLVDPNSSSSRYEAAHTKYLTDSIIFLTNSEVNRAQVQDQQFAVKQKETERATYRKQLSQVYDLSDIEIEQFMQRFDGEGKVTTDNLLSIFRQEQSGMTRDEIIAARKANLMREQKAKRKVSGPGAVTGGNKSVAKADKKSDDALLNAEDLTQDELDKIDYIDM